MIREARSHVRRVVIGMAALSTIVGGTLLTTTPASAGSIDTAQLSCSVDAPGAPVMKCTLTDADGIARVTVRDNAGNLLIQNNLDCLPRPGENYLEFRYTSPNTIQKVILTDCAGQRKIFKVRKDGSVFVP